jgi:hypothetical protein
VPEWVHPGALVRSEVFNGEDPEVCNQLCLLPTALPVLAQSFARQSQLVT